MMRLGLPLMVAVGAAIALALPTGRGPASVRAPNTSSPQTVHPVLSPAPPATVTVVTGETVIPSDDSGRFVATAVVNGVTLPMIVDTGAGTVALTVDDARAAHITVDPNTFAVIGRGASGDVKGVIVTLDTVAVDGRTVGGVRGAVIEGLDRSLLGQSYLARTGGVSMKNDEMRLS